MARVGILGGTFNPPHVGHLGCARAALDELRLDRVLLMPVAAPPHKEVTDEPGAEHRLAMGRLAAADDARLEASGLEVERGGPSYTVDTLRQLHENAPEDQLTFIAGGDVAVSLPRWRDPEGILELAEFAVAEREGSRRADIERALGALRGRDRIGFFAMRPVDVSSTMVREAVAAGRPIGDLVPAAVADYIESNGLYETAVSAR